MKYINLGTLLFYEPYKYNYYCSPSDGICLTVITYTKPNIGDTPFKRYIVIGRNKYRLPLDVSYIEYPNDTGLVIIWETASRCKIISNQPAEKIMNLSNKVNFNIIYDNELYEQFSKQYPNLSL
jgi:hypothetical protein